MTRIGDGVLDRRGSLGLVLVFGGQTLPTGGEVGLRAGRPWSVAREILWPGNASAVLRCPDQWGPGARSRGAWLPSKLAGADKIDAVLGHTSLC